MVKFFEKSYPMSNREILKLLKADETESIRDIIYRGGADISLIVITRGYKKND